MAVRDAELRKVLRGSWATSLLSMPCSSPSSWCASCLCPCAMARRQRNEIMQLTGEPYACCAGLCVCCAKPCRETEPWLCLETGLCTISAALANRFLIQTRFDVQNDPCDDRVILFAAGFACLTGIVRCCMDDDSADACSMIADCCAVSVCCCILAQNQYQLDKDIKPRLRSEPYRGPPAHVSACLPPAQLVMVNSNMGAGTRVTGAYGVTTYGAAGAGHQARPQPKSIMARRGSAARSSQEDDVHHSPSRVRFENSSSTSNDSLHVAPPPQARAQGKHGTAAIGGKQGPALSRAATQKMTTLADDSDEEGSMGSLALGIGSRRSEPSVKKPGSPTRRVRLGSDEYEMDKSRSEPMDFHSSTHRKGLAHGGPQGGAVARTRSEPKASPRRKRGSSSASDHDTGSAASHQPHHRPMTREGGRALRGGARSEPRRRSSAGTSGGGVGASLPLGASPRARRSSAGGRLPVPLRVRSEGRAPRREAGGRRSGGGWDESSDAYDVEGRNRAEQRGGDAGAPSRSSGEHEDFGGAAELFGEEEDMGASITLREGRSRPQPPPDLRDVFGASASSRPETDVVRGTAPSSAAPAPAPAPAAQRRPAGGGAGAAGAGGGEYSAAGGAGGGAGGRRAAAAFAKKYEDHLHVHRDDGPRPRSPRNGV